MLKAIFCLELDIIRTFPDYWRYDIWSRFLFTLWINMTENGAFTATRLATLSNKETSARAVSVGRQKRVPLDWLLGNFSALFEIRNFIVQYPLQGLRILRLVKKCPTAQNWSAYAQMSDIRPYLEPVYKTFPAFTTVSARFNPILASYTRICVIFSGTVFI
jgi:hypothetical protein